MWCAAPFILKGRFTSFLAFGSLAFSLSCSFGSFFLPSLADLSSPWVFTFDWSGLTSLSALLPLLLSLPALLVLGAFPPFPPLPKRPAILSTALPIHLSSAPCTLS